MTASQIIEEIDVLSSKEQLDIFNSLRERLKEREQAPQGITFADHDEAMHIADKIFTQRVDLFKRLAQ